MKTFFENYYFIATFVGLPISLIAILSLFFLIDKKGYLYIYICLLSNIILFLIKKTTFGTSRLPN